MVGAGGNAETCPTQTDKVQKLRAEVVTAGEGASTQKPVQPMNRYTRGQNSNTAAADKGLVSPNWEISRSQCSDIINDQLGFSDSLSKAGISLFIFIPSSGGSDKLGQVCHHTPPPPRGAGLSSHF